MGVSAKLGQFANGLGSILIGNLKGVRHCKIISLEAILFFRGIDALPKAQSEPAHSFYS